MNSGSHYPPGVTGNEPEIAGDDSWEKVHEQIDETCRKKGWTDCEMAVAWMLGVQALEAVRSLGGRFPSDCDEKPVVIAIGTRPSTGNDARDAMLNNRGISSNS